MHVMLIPQRSDRRGDLLQRLDERDHAFIIGCLRKIPPETRQNLRSLDCPFHDPASQPIVCEQHPEHIPFSGIALLSVNTLMHPISAGPKPSA